MIVQISLVSVASICVHFTVGRDDGDGFLTKLSGQSHGEESSDDELFDSITNESVQVT